MFPVWDTASAKYSTHKRDKPLVATFPAKAVGSRLGLPTGKEGVRKKSRNVPWGDTHGRLFAGVFEG